MSIFTTYQNPDPNCPYCKDRPGVVTSQHTGGGNLFQRCVCTDPGAVRQVESGLLRKLKVRALSYGGVAAYMILDSLHHNGVPHAAAAKISLIYSLARRLTDEEFEAIFPAKVDHGAK